MPIAHPGWSASLATLGLMMLSLGGVVRLIAQAGIQQSVTPNYLLGRMSATFRFVTWGVMPIGGLLGGAAGSLVGAKQTLLIGAGGMTLAFLPSFLSSALRTAQEPPRVGVVRREGQADVPQFVGE